MEEKRKVLEFNPSFLALYFWGVVGLISEEMKGRSLGFPSIMAVEVRSGPCHNAVHKGIRNGH